MSAHFANQDISDVIEGVSDVIEDCMGFSVCYDDMQRRIGPLSTYGKPNLWASTRTLVSQQNGAMMIGTLRQMAGIILNCEDDLHHVQLGDANPYFQLVYFCKAVLRQCANVDQDAPYEDSEEHNMLEDFAQQRFGEDEDEPYQPWNLDNSITTGTSAKIGGTCNVNINTVNQYDSTCTSSSGESDTGSDDDDQDCDIHNINPHFTYTSSEESDVSYDESDTSGEGYEQDCNAIHWDQDEQCYQDGHGLRLHTMTKQQLRDELLEIVRQRDAEEAQSRYTVTGLDEPRPDTDEDRESDDSTDDYIPPPHTRCGEYGTEHCDCNHQNADWYHTPEDEWEGWAQRHNFEPYEDSATRNVPASWRGQQ